MSPLKKLKLLLPFFIRKKILKFYRNILWRVYFNRYIKFIKKGKIPDKHLINNLVLSWNNQGYSSQNDYIQTMINYASKSHKLIFECGTGLSTLLLGVIAKHRNVHMISFEHIHTWANKVKKEINKYKLSNNSIYIRPLKNYGDFDWYDINKIKIKKIGLCVCDGPPGKTYGGRKGFLYLFKENVESGSIILVDDVTRKAEQEMIKEWKKILKFDVNYQGENDPHAILKIH